VKTLRALPLLLFALALVWYGALALRFHTHGALGDDPATYVQMARDLAQHGTVVHEFPLLTKLFAQGLSWDAFLTPGYHVVRETGFVAPNFAFGFPLLLAIGYRVFGESALDWTTPLLGALALLATFALGNELLRDFSPTRRRAIRALAVLLLATSPKQIQLALVPMSDVPTQLFCVLAVWCALRASRQFVISSDSEKSPADTRRDFSLRNAPLEMTARYAFAALCGLSLGMAYLIRHSALAMVVPLVIVAARWSGTKRARVLLIFIALALFALTILPDGLYRANVLGSIFAVESPESAQMVWLDAPRQFLRMLGALFSVTGFGPLVLFVPLGCWVLAREKNQFAAFVLASWILAFMLLHAPLFLTGVFENTLRYLIPAYPALALSVSVAVVWSLERAWNGRRAAPTRYAPRTFAAYALALIGIVALAIALRAVMNPERFVARAYGWMSETARADLETLNAQLPRNAVIGASDQMAGATLLYAQREIFRPANFLEPTREFPQFLETMKKEKRAVYLLGEWNCAGDASEKLPQWLGEWEMKDRGLEIRDLPYGCAQRVWHMTVQ
jgi:4-amino-4-deoxy-L-arabinose transferase-like glycosyltransferase